MFTCKCLSNEVPFLCDIPDIARFNLVYHGLPGLTLFMNLVNQS